MTTSLIYEVECQLDPDIVADYDAWLPGHVQGVLACPGFQGASVETPEAAQGERQRRRVRYRVESAAALDRYLENDAPRLRADAVQRFGGRLQCKRRTYRPRDEIVPASRQPVRCLNCGTVVQGRHCAQCGQAGDVHVLSMKEVVGDVTHSLLHLDSRVWRTLRLLVRKPGELTREFIAGRHQTYIPPFRLYLAISILYFALTALMPDSDSVDIDLQPPEHAAGTPVTAGDDSEGTCNVNLWGDDSEVTQFEAALSRACTNARLDGGRHLFERFASTAPKLMFLFLPLIAGVALLFYWRPRRLYAEHLVLFLHNHAFTFLLMGAGSILVAIADIEFPLAGAVGFLAFLVYCYLPYYVYRSMRVVYAEGRLRTLLKFLTLSTIYFLLLGVTMLLGLVITALSLS